MPAKNRPTVSIDQITTQIKASEKDWVAGKTPLSSMSPENQDSHLGLAVPEKEMERIEGVLAQETAVFEFADECDWRDKDGSNWVTEIRDQGACGSCVAFATVGAIECQANIQKDDPGFGLNLSEADLFFCGAGRNCKKGWWPSYALDYAKSQGISDEDCFEYEDTDVDCTVCAEKPARHVKIGSWQEVVNVGQRKDWLDTKGPMIACMAVYRDFFAYKNGVYRHVTGDLAGYHAICCIGYSKAEDCWICKNSWGTDWGDQGYFKIGYGEADIDARFAMYGVENLTGPLMDTDDDLDGAWVMADAVAVEHAFDRAQPVLWAYAQGKWRGKTVSDAQLDGLDSLLAVANPVQICFKNDELLRIRLVRKIGKQ